MEVTLLEGKHHQIRRMAKRNFFSVVELKRKKIAGILSLDSGLEEPGSCRWLTKNEEHRIFQGIRRLREKLHSKQVSDENNFDSRDVEVNQLEEEQQESRSEDNSFSSYESHD